MKDVMAGQINVNCFDGEAPRGAITLKNENTYIFHFNEEFPMTDPRMCTDNDCFNMVFVGEPSQQRTDTKKFNKIQNLRYLHSKIFCKTCKNTLNNLWEISEVGTFYRTCDCNIWDDCFDEIYENVNLVRTMILARCHAKNDFELPFDILAILPIAFSPFVVATLAEAIENGELHSEIRYVKSEKEEFISHRQIPTYKKYITRNEPEDVVNVQFVDNFDLLDSDLPILHCVSSDLAQSKGIARSLKEKYYPNFSPSADLKLKLLKEFPCIYPQPNSIRIIIDLVTKKKYFNKPSVENLAISLDHTIKFLKDHNIKDICCPLLGSGLDKISPEISRSLIIHAFSETGINVLVSKGFDNRIEPIKFTKEDFVVSTPIINDPFPPQKKQPIIQFVSDLDLEIIQDIISTKSETIISISKENQSIVETIPEIKTEIVQELSLLKTELNNSISNNVSEFQATISIPQIEDKIYTIKSVEPVKPKIPLSNNNILKTINNKIKNNYEHVENCWCHQKSVRCFKNYRKDYSGLNFYQTRKIVTEQVKLSLKYKCTKIFKHPQVSKIAKFIKEQLIKNQILQEKLDTSYNGKMKTLEVGKRTRVIKSQKISNYYFNENPLWNRTTFHFIPLDSYTALCFKNILTSEVVDYRQERLKYINNKRKINRCQESNTKITSDKLTRAEYLILKHFKNQYTEDYEPELPEDFEHIESETLKFKSRLQRKIAFNKYKRQTQKDEQILNSTAEIVTLLDMIKEEVKNSNLITKTKNTKYPFELINNKLCLNNHEFGPINDPITNKNIIDWVNEEMDNIVDSLNIPEEQNILSLSSLVEEKIKDSLAKYIQNPKILGFLISQLVGIVINIMSSTMAIVDAIKESLGWSRIIIHVAALFATICQGIWTTLLGLEIFNTVKKNSMNLENFKADIQSTVSSMIIEFVPKEYHEEVKSFLNIDNVINSPTKDEINRLRYSTIPKVKRVIQYTKEHQNLKTQDCQDLVKELNELTDKIDKIRDDPEYDRLLKLFELLPDQKYENIFKGCSIASQKLIFETQDPYLMLDFVLACESYIRTLKISIQDNTVSQGVRGIIKGIFLNLEYLVQRISSTPGQTPLVSLILFRASKIIDILHESVNIRMWIGTNLLIIADKFVSLKWLEPSKTLVPFDYSYKTYLNFACPAYQAITDIKPETALSIFSGILATSMGIYDMYSGVDIRRGVQARFVMGNNTVRAMADTTKQIKQYTEDLAYDVFGYAIADAHYIRETGSKYKKKLEDCLAVSNEEYVSKPSDYFNFTQLTVDVDKFMSRLSIKNQSLNVYEQSILNTLKNLLLRCDEKAREIISGYKKSGLRIVPTWMHFYGASGAGKSTFVNREIIPELSQQAGCSLGPYTIHVNDDRGFFFPPYLGQPVCLVDEFLKLGANDPLIGKMTEIIDSDPYVLEGAAISTKDQMCQFKHVITISNRRCFDLNDQQQARWTREVMEAFIGRRRAIHVINVNSFTTIKNGKTILNKEIRNIDRGFIKHTENYTELKFVEYKIPNLRTKYDVEMVLEQRIAEYPHLKVTNNKYQAYKYDPQNNEMNVATEGDGTEPLPDFWYILDKYTDAGHPVYARFFTSKTIFDEIKLEYQQRLDDYRVSCKGVLGKHLTALANQYPDMAPLEIADKFRGNISFLNYESVLIQEVIDEYIAAQLPLPIEEASYGTTSHLTCTIFGASNVGKSTSATMLSEELRLVYPQFSIVRASKSKEIENLPNTPHIVITDDILDKDQGRLYMDIVDKIPSGSVIINTTNMRFKRIKSPSLALKSTFINIQDAPWHRKLLMYTGLLWNKPYVFTSHDKNGKPYEDYEEGWYRRLGVPGIHQPMSVWNNTNMNREKNFQLISLLFLIVFLLNSSFLFMPFLIFAFFLINHLFIDTVNPKFDAACPNTEKCILLEQLYPEGFHTCGQKLSEPCFGHREVLELLSSGINKMKTSNQNIYLKEVKEEFTTPEADVIIRVKSLKDLPKLLNNPQLVIASVGKTTLPSISLSMNLMTREFRTCVREWFVPEDVKNTEEVINAAKRTYNSLLNIGSDLTVSVECSDFHAYGSNNTIRWWMPSADTNRWQCQEERIGDIDFIKFFNSTEIFYVDLITVKAVCIGQENNYIKKLFNFSNNNNEENIIQDSELTFAERKIIIQLKSQLKIFRTMRDASLEPPPSLSAKVVNESIQKTAKRIERIQGGILINICMGLVALIGVFGLSYGLYALITKNKSTSKNKSKEICEYISNLKELPLNYSDNNISIEGLINIKNSGLFSISVNYNISKVNGSAMNTLLTDSFKTYVINHVKKTIICGMGIKNKDIDVFNFDFTFTLDPKVQSQPTTNYQYQEDRYLWDSFDMIKIATIRYPVEPMYKAEFRITILDETKPSGICKYIEAEYIPEIGKFSIVHITPDNNFKKEEFLKNFEHFLNSAFELARFKHHNTEQQGLSSADNKNKFRSSNKIPKFMFKYVDRQIYDPEIEAFKDAKSGKLWDDFVKQSYTVQYDNVEGIRGLNQEDNTTFNANFNKIKNATVIVKNMTHDLLQYGLIFKERFVLINSHLIVDSDSLITINCMHKEQYSILTASIVHDDPLNDIAILQIDDKTFPSYPDITKLFITDIDYELLDTYGYFWRPSSYENQTIFATSLRKVTYPKGLAVRDRNGTLKNHLGNLAMVRFYKSGFKPQRGDCGLPHMISIGNHKDMRICGIHALGISDSLDAWSAVVTQDQLKYYVQTIKSKSNIIQEQALSVPQVNLHEEIIYEPINRSVLNHETQQLIGNKIEDVVVDKVINQIINSEIKLPDEQWPLFRPNKYQYGEIKNSNTTLITYHPRFKSSHLQKSAHKPSPFVNWLENEGVQCPVDNSVINETFVNDKSSLIKAVGSDKASIMFTQASFYNDVIIESDEMQKYIHETNVEIRAVYNNWYPCNHKITFPTDEEVINGYYIQHGPFWRECERIAQDTSPGAFSLFFLGKTNKLDFFTVDEKRTEELSSIQTIYGPPNCKRPIHKFSNSPTAKFIKKRFETKWNLMLQGIWYAMPFKASIKDETVKLDKVEKGLSRLFEAGDVCQLMIEKKILMPIAALMKINRHVGSCSVGLDPIEEFKILYHRLKNFSPFGEAGDFKNWDKHIKANVIKSFVQTVKHIYEEYWSQEEKDKYKKLWNVMYMDLANSFSILDGFLVQHARGVKSGTYATVYVNSFANDFMHVCCIKLLMKTIPPSVSEKFNLTGSALSVYNITNTLNLGDDKVTAIKSDLLEWVNFNTMQVAYNTGFGIQYTNPDKSGGTYSFKKIHELEFLSRKFNVDSTTGVVLPTLKDNSLYSMLFFTTDYQPDVIETTLLNLRKELLYVYPKEKYEHYRYLFNNVIKIFRREYQTQLSILFPLDPFEQNITQLHALNFTKTKEPILPVFNNMFTLINHSPCDSTLNDHKNQKNFRARQLAIHDGCPSLSRPKKIPKLETILEHV